jgi:hypothetical protein
MNEPEIERLKILYADLPDAELRRIESGAGGYTPEAAAAAKSILRVRNPTPDNQLTSGRDDDSSDRCDCCGITDHIEYVPFVAACDDGRDWAVTIASAAVSALVIPGGHVGAALPPRRVSNPLTLWLGICAKCEDEWSDSSGRLAADAYTHCPDYPALEAQGYNVIIREHEMPQWGFERLERRRS